MATREERQGWLSNWVSGLYEFASLAFQRRVWVEASIPNCMGSYTELMCGYFDDRHLSDGYEWAIDEGLLSSAEARAVDRFHRAADVYNGDYDHHTEYLADPSWQAVASLAADAWRRLKDVAGENVLAEMQHYEADWGAVPRGRDWETGLASEWIEAELTVVPTEKGGREHGIVTGYRACWDNGDRLKSGDKNFHDASVSVGGEPLSAGFGERWIQTGESGTVRLHPLRSEFWQRVAVGDELRMYEGARLVGSAVVQRVGLTPLF